jgi:hypothetical protein
MKVLVGDKVKVYRLDKTVAPFNRKVYMYTGEFVSEINEDNLQDESMLDEVKRYGKIWVIRDEKNKVDFIPIDLCEVIESD